MSSEPIKSWNRAWTTQEIIDNASNWSLAGDAGLLKYLESFSEDLLSRASTTNDNLNKLLDDLNNASLALDTAKNVFSSLRNTQFIESRVYEEDETLAGQSETQTQSQSENADDKGNADEEKVRDTKEAILRGIEIVEKYYEKVEVPASDTEDETDFPSFVLNPKDPYIDRPLPYVIGSSEWYKKWHVGLLDSSSESEQENVSEKFSDTDSDDNLPIQNRTLIKGASNSESEADLSNKINMSHPVANSTFDESIKHPDIFGSSDSEENNSIPAQAPISNRNFARELAAKLGDVIEQNPQIVEPEINKRPINHAPATTRIVGNLFSDEPPPLDDDEDEELFGTKGQQGLFSGSGGLFDDLDDDNGDSLWKEDKKVVRQKPETAPPTTKPKLPNLFDDDDDFMFNKAMSQFKSDAPPDDSSSPPTKVTEAKKISTGGLFDDNEEDNLFNDLETTLPSTIKPYLPSDNKTAMPYFNEEPPELDSSQSTKKTKDNAMSKKPVGGVKLFGNTDLFAQQKIGDIVKSRRQESTESADDDPISVENVTVEPPKDSSTFFDDASNLEKPLKQNDPQPKLEIETKSDKKAKRISLFDEEDDGELLDNDLFSSMSTKKFTSSLFDDKPLDDDLFDASSANKEFGIGSVQGLFSTRVTMVTEQPTNVKSTKSEVGDAVSDQFSVSEVHKSTEKSPTKPPEPKTTSKVLSLFDDDENYNENSDQDDLFASSNLLPSKKVTERKLDTSNASPLKPSEEEKGDKVPTSSRNVTATKSNSVNINFFDQNPPELDDEWDVKSENNLFEDTEPVLFENLSEISGPRSGLFDNEPPSLFSESSGIVRDASARTEQDDSFNPYASSSRRFSVDIFTEQQSSDSFFVTKSKLSLDPQNLPPTNLAGIPESTKAQQQTNESQSNLEITPSGDADDLFSDSTVTFSEQQLNITGDLLKSGLDASEAPNGKDGSLMEEKIPKEKPVIAKKPVVEKKEDEIDGDAHNLFSSKIGSPGKLKHNLQINVHALMPGISPPKKKELEKSRSLEVASSEEDSITQLSIKSVPTFTDYETSPRQKSDGSPSDERRPEVLHSITKDRVRIPIKRRPSTRKGRQETLRKSAVLNLDFDDKTEETKESTTDQRDSTSEITPEQLDPCLTELTFQSQPLSVEQKQLEPEPQQLQPEQKQLKPEQKQLKPEPQQLQSEQKQLKSEQKQLKPEQKQLKPEQKKSKSEQKQLKPEQKQLKPEQKKSKSEQNQLKSEQKQSKPEPQQTPSETTKQLTFEEIFGDGTNEDDDLFSLSVEEKVSKPHVTSLFDTVESNAVFEEPPLLKTPAEALQQTKEAPVEDEPAKPSMFGGHRRSVINSDSFESEDFKKDDLFDDSEEFGDIFSSKKLPPKSNILKKSLFDDDDDDDIFGSSTSSVSAKKIVVNKVPERKPIKSSIVRKLGNSDVVDDPLSLFDDPDSI